MSLKVGPGVPPILLQAVMENETEYTRFAEWWEEYAKTLNQRATLVWQELAWAGWFARSEIADGKLPSTFPENRRKPSQDLST